ncbi:MAG: hypothetical protein K9L59_13925 [Desulfobacterales bacterium]|nr:hypothetical protein [Desulfobacterales bacterium]
MMPKTAFRWIVGLAVLLVAGLWLAGCATVGSSAKEEGIAPGIVYQVPDSAEIAKVAYYFKEYKGASRLHMDVTIKNTSPETRRFRVNIFLPEGPSGGGLYPRKVKEDAQGIEAGQEHTREFPMYFNQLPSGFMIVVREMS